MLLVPLLPLVPLIPLVLSHIRNPYPYNSRLLFFSDVQTELIVIDRALYKRSVESVLKKQFEEKQNFINNCKFFQGWSLRYKKQLAMALQRDTLPYDSLLTKQGEPFNAIYFILRFVKRIPRKILNHESFSTRVVRSVLMLGYLSGGHALEPCSRHIRWISLASQPQ